MEVREIIIILVLVNILRLELAQTIQLQDTEHKSSACYGTVNNYLELSCEFGEIISVTDVIYGAKLKSDECPNPTTNNEHPPSCCKLTETDCVILPPAGKPDPYLKQCSGQTTCSMQTRWLDTQGQCSEDYLAHTSFMQLTYTCLNKSNNRSNAAASKVSSTSPPTSPAKVSTTTITTTTVTTTAPPTTTTTTSAQPTTKSTTTKTLSVGPRLHIQSDRSTAGPRADSESTSSTPAAKRRHVELDVSFTTPQSTTRTIEAETSSFAFTTGMMGGMTAAIIGLMLTIFGFLFYWGRRKRKLTTMKPNNSTVWDFLLAHTVAARTFRRGYDNFTNNRESVSSEGDLGVGKQTWLPNIRVEPGIDTQSVTSDENCSIVNISALGSGHNTISSRHDRSEA